MDKVDAIVLIDHGSKRPQAHLDMSELAEKIERKSGITCLVAHMEIAEPSLMAIATQLNKSDKKNVKVVPWFLSSGRHLEEDIPAQFLEVQKAFPALSLALCSPLRDAGGLIDIALELALQK